MNKLLSINNYFYLRDGAATVFFQHNDILKENGWDICHFSMQHAKNQQSPWSDYFVDEMEFGQQYSLTQKVLKAPRFIYSLQARRNLANLIDQQNISICHCHSIYHHISPSILSLLKARGIPTVMTMHDLKPACPTYFMFRHGNICEECKGGKIRNVVRHRCSKGSLLYSSMVYFETIVHRLLSSYEKNIDCFISPSEFYIQKFSEFGFTESQFVHIPNPINIAKKDQFSPTSKSPYIMYAGRLSEEKGVDVLLKAAALARVKVLIAGDGPEKEALKELAENLSVEAEFLGFMPHATLMPLLASARVSVLPSVWYENAPMSILESLAVGTPAIGSAIGGIPEMLAPHDGGHLVEAGNVEMLAEILARYKYMPDSTLHSQAETGFKFVRKKHCREQYLHAIAALYSNMQEAAA